MIPKEVAEKVEDMPSYILDEILLFIIDI